MIRTNQERQAELRQRRRDAGLKPLTVWLPQEAVNLLARYPRERRAEVITQALLAYNSNATITHSNEAELGHPLSHFTERLEGFEQRLARLEQTVMRNVTITNGNDSQSLTGESTGELTSKDASGLVSLAVELHEKGLSWAEIARRWNAEGIPTPTGQGRWHGANITRLVKAHSGYGEN